MGRKEESRREKKEKGAIDKEGQGKEVAVGFLTTWLEVSSCSECTAKAHLWAGGR